MTAQEIYDRYKIIPTLQLHQLRVAAVGQIICDSIPDFKDEKDVVSTCLLHDMGNIIKFDLNYFPDFLQPEGLEYWQKVKDKYIQKYGNDEHHATQDIISELVNSKKIKEYANMIGFAKLQEVQKCSSLAQKICAYSDMRVGPHGVISIKERLQDGRKRYTGREDKEVEGNKYDNLVESLKQIESQIFETTKINPTDITDELIGKRISELRGFVI